MPRATCGHALAFYKGDDVCCGVCVFECAIVAMQVVKGDIENALCTQSHGRRVVTGGFIAGFVRERKNPQITLRVLLALH